MADEDYDNHPTSVYMENVRLRLFSDFQEE